MIWKYNKTEITKDFKYKKLNSDYMNLYNRNPHLYLILGLIWLIIMIIFEHFVINIAIYPTFKKGRFVLVGLLILNQFFVALFYFYGLSNLIFPIYYACIRKKEAEYERDLLSKPLPKDWHPKVKMLYTTFNDFLPYAAAQTMDQTYDNIDFVILDNSNDQKYIDMISQFCYVHPQVQWVHKYPNKGAKAGNLNNYLDDVGKGTYDYFVILDSDELLQNDFVEKSLKFFYYTKNLGVLQCNHISGSNVNKFMRLFSASGDSFWPVQNSVRSTGSGFSQPEYNAYGRLEKEKRISRADTTSIELGHGTMVSARAMESIGNHMPEMVAEDLCLSFVLLLNGFNIKFSTQIYGNEQFPVNMNALMIRSSKFCRANFQFMHVFGKRLLTTKMLTFTQKLDLMSFTLSVPIFAAEYISLLLCSIVFPLTDTPSGYIFIFLFPSLICYFSQSIADACFQLAGKHKIWWVLEYEFESALLYGSFYWSTVKSTIFAALVKKAQFTVTPKELDKITYKQVFKENWESVLFSLVTILVSWYCSGSSWILMSFAPGCLGWMLARKANHQSDQDKRVEDCLKQGSINALLHPDAKPVPWNI